MAWLSDVLACHVHSGYGLRLQQNKAGSMHMYVQQAVVAFRKTIGQYWMNCHDPEWIVIGTAILKRMGTKLRSC